MSVEFKRSGSGVVKDHNELANKGVRTHAEIDLYMAELDDARGSNPSIDARFDSVEDKLLADEADITAIQDQQAENELAVATLEARLSADEGLISENSDRISSIEDEVTAARNGEPTLKARLDILATGSQTSQEVINAREGYANLDSRLDAMQALINQGGGGGGVVGTVTGLPVGAVSYYAANSVPAGWLIADGSAVSRTYYTDLYAVIGTAFGIGDGSTTFNLPDLRGQFIRGYDGGRGIDNGRTFGSSQDDDFKSHSHSPGPNGGSFLTAFAGGNVAGWATGGNWGGVTGNTNTTYPTGGAETRPKNIALLGCIKYEKDDITIDLQEVVDARSGADGTDYSTLDERLDAMETKIGQGGGGGTPSNAATMDYQASLPGTRPAPQSEFTVLDHTVGLSIIFVDGIHAPRSEYTETGTAITFTYEIPVSAHVEFFLFNAVIGTIINTVVQTETALPVNGVADELYVVRFDSTAGGKPTVYFYNGSAYQKISGGGGSELQQVTKLGVTATQASPKTVDIPIPVTNDFKLPPISVLKFIAGASNVVSTISSFSNTESTDFNDNSKVAFDGVMKLITSSTASLGSAQTVGTGTMISAAIDLTKYKKVTKIEVI